MKVRIQWIGKVCIGHNDDGSSRFADDLDVVDIDDALAAMLIERGMAFAIGDDGKRPKVKKELPSNG